MVTILGIPDQRAEPGRGHLLEQLDRTIGGTIIHDDNRLHRVTEEVVDRPEQLRDQPLGVVVDAGDDEARWCFRPGRRPPNWTSRMCRH